MSREIFIGTSGYSYMHWMDKDPPLKETGEFRFYPKNIPQREWLEYYAQYFNSVELNVTFYRLPKESVFDGWHKRAPDNFRFVIKGSRFITHIKRLKDAEEPLERFMKRAVRLKDKLKCVLWQMPPNLSYNPKRIKNFISLLKNQPQCLHSFEFRNESWFNEELYGILKENNINLCIADSPSYPYKEVFTSDFLYLRFHGGRRLYGSKYSPEELKQWVDKASVWMKDKNIMFAFFNNDAHGFAVENALYFQKLVDKWKITN